MLWKKRKITTADTLRTIKPLIFYRTLRIKSNNAETPILKWQYSSPWGILKHSLGVSISVGMTTSRQTQQGSISDCKMIIPGSHNWMRATPMTSPESTQSATEGERVAPLHCTSHSNTPLQTGATAHCTSWHFPHNLPIHFAVRVLIHFQGFRTKAKTLKPLQVSQEVYSVFLINISDLINSVRSFQVYTQILSGSLHCPMPVPPPAGEGCS